MTEINADDCVIQCTYALPYRLKSVQGGEFIAEKSYSSPAFLFANLDTLAQSRTYNFVWVGIVAT